MKTRIYDMEEEYQEGMRAAQEAIGRGELVAFPTETVYGLGASAMDAGAVDRIFLAKGRPQDNPLIVHVAGVEQAKGLTTDWTEQAQALSEAFWPGPLSLIVSNGGKVAKNVTAGMDSVALRMPNNPIALELIRRCGPIAAPSANISGRPSPVLAEHVQEDLDGKVPVILNGGRCRYSVESTVVDVRKDIPVLLRPGGITRENIIRIAGACEVAKGVFERVQAGQALSPGMAHKHYAPKGRAVIIREGENQEEHLRMRYEKARAEGMRCVILCAEESAKAYVGCETMVLGKRENLSTGLFDALRRCDAEGYVCILIEGAPAKGMNLAFMNRAIRAANFQLED